MKNLLFSKSHEWVKIEGNKATIGLSDYAQHELGDIVYINLPSIGDKITIGESFTDVESVKAVSEVYSPVSGTITAVNDELESQPELINNAPYDAWIVTVELSDKGELMTKEEYEKFCK